METLLRKMRVKYDINRLSNKELKEYLNKSENYDEFIDDLALVLNKESGYEFVYLDKLKTIKKAIRKNKETRKLTTDEKSILRVLSMKDLTLKQKIDFKTQYIYMYLYGLGVPASLRDEAFYKRVARDNYENIFRFYDVLNTTNAYYKDTAISLLASDITTLATINTILKESNNVDNELYGLLVDITTKKPDKNSFENVHDYHKYKRYQYKTLKQLKTGINKVNDTDKVLIK